VGVVAVDNDNKFLINILSLSTSLEMCKVFVLFGNDTKTYETKRKLRLRERDISEAA